MHITPGTTFQDDRGRTAQLHGVGVQNIDGTYWAWGENKITGDAFTSVATYSSTDLANWTFRGDALTAVSTPELQGQVVERPKVLRRPDGVYVMFLHVDSSDYPLAEVGYAVSDTPEGPFEYLGSSRAYAAIEQDTRFPTTAPRTTMAEFIRYPPNCRPLGNESRDIGVYQESGKAYLLSEDRRSGLHIYELSDDYLRPLRAVATTTKEGASHGYESPSLVKHDGLYYLFGPDLTGWSHNDNKYSSAEHLEGPWARWQDFAPPGSRTFESQVSVVIQDPSGQYVYIGDRWDKSNLFNSAAVWLSLQVGAGYVKLSWRNEWTLHEYS
ncbi:family 43 glycosylhydrolase [Curtobacterium sp. VKM Ac-1376]|nr:family 43 glycosylhydrolase [Curtobacterium sp. VKM Ac-1376]MBF4616366.1 family 43 glycosylhydrolase [Curtobacterium sp. VKM Ac-1376]